ncbi:MAG: DUF1588 domain-containing protein [Sandaracinus sp.]|nr:DUF1588 domain-containing protein [Sandaracinus sp.]
MDLRYVALASLFGVACSGTIGTPEGASRDPERPPPRGSEALPPDPPDFLLLPYGEPSLLQLDSVQLRAHAQDTLGLTLDDLPEWSAAGSLLPAEQFRGLHASAASRARALPEDHPLVRCEGDVACARAWLEATLPDLQRVEPSSASLEAFAEVYVAWRDAEGDRGAAHGVLSAVLSSPLTLVQHERMADREGPSLRNLVLWNTPSMDVVDEPLDDPRFRRHVAELLRVWLALPPPEHLRRTLEDGTLVSEAQKRDAFDALVDHVVEVVRAGEGFEALLSYGDRGLGVLGEPYVLLTHSASDHRSIVYRGLFVHRQLLCQRVAFPSASIQEEIAETLAEADEGTTQVDFMLARAANERCVVCHQAFDGLGLALVDFSMFGELEPEPARDVEVDLALPTWLETSPSRLRSRDPRDLADRLQNSSVARACFARAWVDAMADGDTTTVGVEAFGGLVDGVLESRPLRDVLEAYVASLESRGGTP